MGESRTGKVKGIKIRTLNGVMIIVSCVIFAFLIYNTVMMPSQYRQLIDHTSEYMACERDAAQVIQASDYLTEQVRLYVENMNVEYMERYFEEVHETRRREKALEELEQHETTDSVRGSLASALECSNKLMDREIYAMKLISLANRYDMDSLPQEVRDVSLKAADAALSPEEMIEEARNLVFNQGYQDAKALIRSHLDHFIDGIIITTSQRQADSERTLSGALSRQRLLVSALFIMNVITFVAITILIVRPLVIHIKSIKDNDLLDITGSYEFKYLALTYNDIYELNAANKAILTQKAEHDALTGVMNRGAYDDLRFILKDSTIPLALAILDVDKFKQVNDVYGHEAGDKVLKKVADLLTQTFRSTDYIIRLGGDEFAVIMTEIVQDSLTAVEKKVARMNDILRKPTDGLPPVSLSVGVAFSQRGFRDEMFRQADRALYTVKASGRCGCRVYSGDGETDDVSQTPGAV